MWARVTSSLLAMGCESKAIHRPRGNPDKGSDSGSDDSSSSADSDNGEASDDSSGSEVGADTSRPKAITVSSSSSEDSGPANDSDVPPHSPPKKAQRKKKTPTIPKKKFAPKVKASLTGSKRGNSDTEKSLRSGSKKSTKKRKRHSDSVAAHEKKSFAASKAAAAKAARQTKPRISKKRKGDGAEAAYAAKLKDVIEKSKAKELALRISIIDECLIPADESEGQRAAVPAMVARVASSFKSNPAGSVSLYFVSDVHNIA